MTALDDALNSSSPMFAPVTIITDWKELQPGYADFAGGIESIRSVGQQIGPNGFEVTQSFDDGLPDPVTMTMSNDASGSLAMDLVGRPGNRADLIGWRAGNSSGDGTGKLITTTYPVDVYFWDYTICAVSITSGDTAVLMDTQYDADDPLAWQLLGKSIDGISTFSATYVFGRQHFSGALPPVFSVTANVNYTWLMVACAAGQTAQKTLVPTTPNPAASAPEEAVTAITPHAAPVINLPSRGYQVGVFSAAASVGPWVAAGDAVIHAQISSGTFALAIARTPLRLVDGDYGMTLNTTAGSRVVMMTHIPLMIRDRDTMDAMAWFSPLNTKSPVYGWERDTAAMSASVNVVTPDGLYATPIFKGQMASVELNGRTADLTAVSETRLRLDRSLTLPTVYGWREGATTDWLATHLLMEGGQFPGISTSQYTRYMASYHGSMRPNMDGPAGYTECTQITTARIADNYFRRQPISVDGPWVTAMYAEHLNDSVINLNNVADRNWATEIPGQDDPLMADFLSQQNSVGRMSFYVRGDVASASPSVLAAFPGDNMLFRATLWNVVRGATTNYVRVQINPNRNFTIWLGSSLVLTGGDLPSDGAWHFIGFMWDYKNGVAAFRRDGLSWNPTGFASASESLPISDASNANSGGYTAFSMDSHLPLAELQLESGLPFSDSFTRFRPTPTLPSLNATYRPTRKPLAVIAETTPVQGWGELQELAKSTMSHLRVNEEDNVEMVPLDYFGETANMTVQTINLVDTEKNASDLAVVEDPSKTRNVVTTEFVETRVGSKIVPIFDLTTALRIVRGTQLITFALDVPTAETHGAAVWYGTTPDFTKLTALQVAGTNPLPTNSNYMTVNTKEDGTGTVLTSTSFTARIVDWTAGTITVRFVSNYSVPVYISNNGQNVPFLRAMGYPIQTNDAYTTVRDVGSIRSRRERALTSGIKWIHDRDTAQQFASALVTLLARPRAVIAVTVMGDPRRRPGQLVELADSGGTQAEGTWRILSITHKGNGAMYIQDLQLVRVGAIGLWDEGIWDESVWSE